MNVHPTQLLLDAQKMLHASAVAERRMNNGQMPNTQTNRATAMLVRRQGRAMAEAFAHLAVRSEAANDEPAPRSLA